MGTSRKNGQFDFLSPRVRFSLIVLGEFLFFGAILGAIRAITNETSCYPFVDLLDP